MKKFKGIFNNFYSWGDVRKSNYKIVYWVYFPQGLKKERKTHIMYSGILHAKSLKQAYKIAKKYNSPYFERIVECKLGKWAIKEFIINKEDYHLSRKDIDNKYKKLPEICL